MGKLFHFYIKNKLKIINLSVEKENLCSIIQYVMGENSITYCINNINKL